MTELRINVRQDGTWHQGCDESSGWVWHAARALNDYMAVNVNVQDVSILELGSGTGWLALQLHARGARMVATDRRGALPLLIQNVVSHQERNNNNSNSGSSFPLPPKNDFDLEVHCLQWGSDGGAAPGFATVPGTFELVIGSDILYLSEYYQDLIETLARHECHQYILAYEQRKPIEEALFQQMAKDFGFDVVVHEAGLNPVNGNPIFILCMTLATKH